MQNTRLEVSTQADGWSSLTLHCTVLDTFPDCIECKLNNYDSAGLASVVLRRSREGVFCGEALLAWPSSDQKISITLPSGTNHKVVFLGARTPERSGRWQLEAIDRKGNVSLRRLAWGDSRIRLALSTTTPRAAPTRRRVLPFPLAHHKLDVSQAAFHNDAPVQATLIDSEGRVISGPFALGGAINAVILGHVDGFSGASVTGWAVKRDGTDTPPHVRVGGPGLGEPAGRAPTRFRPDLDAMFAAPASGFTIPLDRSAFRGLFRRVRVEIDGDVVRRRPIIRGPFAGRFGRYALFFAYAEEADASRRRVAYLANCLSRDLVLALPLARRSRAALEPVLIGTVHRLILTQQADRAISLFHNPVFRRLYPVGQGRAQEITRALVDSVSPNKRSELSRLLERTGNRSPAGELFSLRARLTARNSREKDAAQRALSATIERAGLTYGVLNLAFDSLSVDPAATADALTMKLV